MSTDSSYRFERRVDPCLVDLARLRALYLIQEYAKPRHISGVIHAGQKPNPVLTTLHLSEDYVHSTLGYEIKANQISSALNRLGLDVKSLSPKTWKVTVPSFRADLTRPIDLVEILEGYLKVGNAKPTTGRVTLWNDVKLPGREMFGFPVLQPLCGTIGLTPTTVCP